MPRWVLPSIILILLILAFVFRWEKGPEKREEYKDGFLIITFVHDRWTTEKWVKAYGVINREPKYIEKPIGEEIIWHSYFRRNTLTFLWALIVIVVSSWLWRSIKVAREKQSD